MLAGACGHVDRPRAPAVDASGGTAGASAGAGGAAGTGGDAGTTSSPEGGMPGLPCNGRPEYCERRYGDVVQPTANAAMAYMRPPFAALHQHGRALEQLRRGAQALWLEVHEVEGEPALCLDDCRSGGLPLSEVGTDVTTFLDENPRHVVSLLVDARGSSAALAAWLVASGLAARRHALGEPPFATYTELIDRNERLVVLVRAGDPVVPAGSAGEGGGGGEGGDGTSAGAAGEEAGGRAGSSGSGGTAGASPQPFDRMERHVFHTSALDSVETLDCALARGSRTAALYELVHVLGAPDTATTADLEAGAALANDPAVLEARLRYCGVAWARPPTFLSADFLDVGGVLQTAQTISLE
jgi:hypothetical protein